MSKEEIALELTKLAFSKAQQESKMFNNPAKSEETVTNLYNYIFKNLACSAQNE